ncbi:pseudouridine synthase [Falsigemmobacter intermedius]|uniref:Pseudouridine synthase n=3 Tax=Falsigemmobacter intermedius TaxID=1553448 RepID=A0A3S3V5X0_9RHOB|nr:pseudouridine synthase [Falsigemmobacter intermedius]
MDKTEAGPERIAKVLARSGVASRRDAERMITEGRISVNGKIIESPALDVTRRDKILVDGVPLAPPEPPRLWLFHKPAGLVTTERDELGRPTVFEHLPEGLPRVMSVGRLDLNSEGLLLLTNDGELKRRLELPSTGWLRKYRVRINGRPEDQDFNALREGVVIDGEVFQPMVVSMDRQQGANAWLTVGIREGRNREVRRAMEFVGYTVNRLIRVSYGPFQLGDLEVGEVTEVRPRTLRDQLGLAETPDVAATDGILRTSGTSGRSVKGAAASGSPARARVSGFARGAAKDDGAKAYRSRDDAAPRGGFTRGARDGEERRPAGGFRARDEAPARGGFSRGAAKEEGAKTFRGRDDAAPRGGFTRGARDGEERRPAGGFRARDEAPARGGFSRGAAKDEGAKTFRAREDAAPRGGFTRGARDGEERRPAGGFRARDEAPARGGFSRGAAKDEGAKILRSREDAAPRGGFTRGARDGEERRPAGGFRARDEAPARGGFSRGAAKDEGAKTFRGRDDAAPRGGFSKGPGRDGGAPKAPFGRGPKPGPKPGARPGSKGPRGRG